MIPLTKDVTDRIVSPLNFICGSVIPNMTTYGDRFLKEVIKVNQGLTGRPLIHYDERPSNNKKRHWGCMRTEGRPYGHSEKAPIHRPRESSQEKPTLQTLRLWTCCLQNYETMNFYYLSPPACSNLLQQP